jgi:hypothetical protein
VTLVGCADCGRTSPVPGRTGPAGRLCDGCASRRRPRVPCARCGRAAVVEARRPEGGICAACHKRDPDTRKECGGCHRMMYPARHLADGSYLCQACAPKNQQRCCRCERVRRVNAWTPQGPVCGTCYRSPARLCGVCGQVAPIMHRARAGTPDTCFAAQNGRSGPAMRAGTPATGTGSTAGAARSTATPAHQARPSPARSARAACAPSPDPSRRCSRWARYANAATAPRAPPRRPAPAAAGAAPWSAGTGPEPPCASRAASPASRRHAAPPAPSRPT